MAGVLSLVDLLLDSIGILLIRPFHTRQAHMAHQSRRSRLATWTSPPGLNVTALDNPDRPGNLLDQAGFPLLVFHVAVIGVIVEAYSLLITNVVLRCTRHIDHRGPVVALESKQRQLYSFVVSVRPVGHLRDTIVNTVFLIVHGPDRLRFSSVHSQWTIDNSAPMNRGLTFLTILVFTLGIRSCILDPHRTATSMTDCAFASAIPYWDQCRAPPTNLPPMAENETLKSSPLDVEAVTHLLQSTYNIGISLWLTARRNGITSTGAGNLGVFGSLSSMATKLIHLDGRGSQQRTRVFEAVVVKRLQGGSLRGALTFGHGS
jgi:hypothetical protein